MNLLLIAAAALSAATPAAPSPQWWTQDPIFQQIAARLDGVRAIDNHTHLLEPGAFKPELDDFIDLETAVRMGRGVLRENAERLYGWKGEAKALP